MKALELLGRLSLNMCIANPMERIAISGTDVYEAIIELEALQSSSCEWCIHRSELHEGLTNGVTNGFCVENGFFTRRGFCCNRYEAKDSQ